MDEGKDNGIFDFSGSHQLQLREASFIIFKLPPFFENLGKCLVKTAKYYFRESCFLTFLLNIKNKSHILRYSLVGICLKTESLSK
ncbi:MAG: DUF4143 domain-containing protein [Granulosicoccus sp.]